MIFFFICYLDNSKVIVARQCQQPVRCLKIEVLVFPPSPRPRLRVTYPAKTRVSRSLRRVARATRQPALGGGAYCRYRDCVPFRFGPPATRLQLVRVVRTGKMAGPRVTLYCVAFFAVAAIAPRVHGTVYEKIPLGEWPASLWAYVLSRHCVRRGNFVFGNRIAHSEFEAFTRLEILRRNVEKYILFLKHDLLRYVRSLPRNVIIMYSLRTAYACRPILMYKRYPKGRTGTGFP